MGHDISANLAKPVYAAPVFSVFGGVAELTASGSGYSMESVNSNTMGMTTTYYCGMSMSASPCALP